MTSADRHSGTVTVVSLRLLYLIFRQAAGGALHGSIKQAR